METIKKAILTDLQNGKRLTVLDGINNHLTVDLRKYISLLKKEGVNINSVWVTKNKKSFKEYFLQKEYDFSKINLHVK